MAAKLTTTRKAIAASSRDYFKPLLKPQGFKTRDAGFWRKTDGLLHDIGFQASMWGSANAGRFTINVGVTHPQMYALFMRRPVMSEKHDYWWSVDESTDVPALGETISIVLQTAVLPFLNTLCDHRQFGAYLEAGLRVGIPDLQLQIARALFMHCSDDFQPARDALRTTLSSISGRPGDAMVRSVLEHLEQHA